MDISLDQKETEELFEYPSLVARIQSSFIDLLFILLMMFVLVWLFDHIGVVSDAARVCAMVLLWVVYEPLCTSLGFTLGNYIKRLRVRQYRDRSKRISFFSALIRYVVKIMLGWLSFLTIHSNREKRAIHDLAVGSVVIMM